MKNANLKTLGTMAIAASFLMTGSLSGQREVNQEEAYRLANQIRKKTLMLSNYGPFDYISFGLKQGTSGYVVTLQGYASRLTLKESAERVVAKLETVESIENTIEELPTSRMDDDIRLKVYAAIYYHPTLSRYNPNRGAPVRGGFGSAGDLWRRNRNLGISADPPRGYHPMSIVVKNGTVILEGVCDNDVDKQLARAQATSVSGVLSVTNNLQVLNPSKKK